MTDLCKAAEQALEYLNKVSDWDTTYPIGKAKEELRQALAQPVSGLGHIPYNSRFTKEQRVAFAKKSVATRRANKEKREKLAAQALERKIGLKDDIEALEKKLAHLKRMEIMQSVSCTLTGAALLREEEIIKAAAPYGQVSGVYFLISKGTVVYVGQSVCIYSRLRAHINFDRYAYILCPKGMMDKLESLYIHLLRPERNGNVSNEQKNAPISLDKLFESGI